tara:strand:+ start:17 stop:193 length:177 start_codon:yes stop_codon:yes gene_type:complete
MVKKKSSKVERKVEKASTSELSSMQTQIANTLTLIKDLTEIVEAQGKILQKIKGRMGL